MKVRINIDPDIKEDEVVINCQSINPNVQKLQEYISNLNSQAKQLTFFQNDKEFYLPLEKILFFETDTGTVSAHTTSDIYQVKYKLYELEEILPGFFMRVSKSTILNTNAIYSITRNITSSSIVEFENTHKIVYVSRNYFKPLKSKLEEKRLHI